MATITQIKTQLQNANTLGLTNLEAKGITTTNLDTTYKIMQAIADIEQSSGGGDSSGGGFQFLPHDIMLWDGDTTNITDRLIVLDEPDGDGCAGFYKVATVQDFEDNISNSVANFSFFTNQETEEMPSACAYSEEEYALWVADEAPMMVLCVDPESTIEFEGATLSFPATGLYLLKQEFTVDDEILSMYPNFIINPATLYFQNTITYSSGQGNGFELDFYGTKLTHINSNSIAYDTYSPTTYKAIPQSGEQITAIPICVFSQQQSVIALANPSAPAIPIAICALQPCVFNNVQIPYAGTYLDLQNYTGIFMSYNSGS